MPQTWEVFFCFHQDILNGKVVQKDVIIKIKSFSWLSNQKYYISKILKKLSLFINECVLLNKTESQGNIVAWQWWSPEQLPAMNKPREDLLSAVECSASPQWFVAQELSLSLYCHDLPLPAKQPDISGLDLGPEQPRDWEMLRDSAPHSLAISRRWICLLTLGMAGGVGVSSWAICFMSIAELWCPCIRVWKWTLMEKACV